MPWRPTQARDDVSESDELFDDAFQRRLEYLAIVSRRLVAGQNRADRRSKRTGGGVEFADHRQYSPGDDIRFVDWKVYGRLGRLLLRLYQEEEDLSVYLLLDSSASMDAGEPSKLRFAKRLTAALAYIGLAHMDRVSVLSIRDAVVARMPPTRSRGRIFSVFRFLRGVQSAGHTDLAKGARSFVAQHKRRGVVVLVSDLLDPDGLGDALDALRYARFEPYVVQLTSRVDRDDDLLGDVTLVDAESGVERHVTVTPAVLARYREAYAALCKQARDMCVTKRVPYFDVDVTTSLEDSVLRLLRHGGMVR